MTHKTLNIYDPCDWLFDIKGAPAECLTFCCFAQKDRTKNMKLLSFRQSLKNWVYLLSISSHVVF